MWLSPFYFPRTGNEIEIRHALFFPAQISDDMKKATLTKEIPTAAIIEDTTTARLQQDTLKATIVNPVFFAKIQT